MKNLFLKSVVLTVAGVGLLAGSALAISLGPEYELISPNPIAGTPAYTPGSDLGYYIWTDDESRVDWHIRWSGAGPNTFFSGSIVLENNEFDSFADFSFEGGDCYRVTNDDAAGYFAIANVAEDGLDFSITQSSTPSYIGFDLFMDFNNDIGDAIYFGANNITAASLGSDGDFKVAAPVPEPATMLLFGTGLAGLAGFARRKKAQKK